MKVSVIVAAYNIEEYIERCILSIINQTLKEIEIIIVNDGSTDKTLEKIINLSLKDNRIKVVNKNNEGVLEARKTGLNVSNGEYILFVDGDDWLENNTLEILYSSAKTGNKDIILYNAFWSYDDRKEVRENLNKLGNDIIASLLLGNIMASICSKFIKKSYIVNNNIKFPNNMEYGEDLAMSFELLLHNPSIDIIDENLYNYYQRKDSITKIYTNKVLDLDKVLNFIRYRLDEKNIYEIYRKEFEYLVFSHLFFYRVIKNDNLKFNQNKIHEKWKQREINIYKNKYIRLYLDNEPLSSRLRIGFYNTNYKLGKVYDFSRESFKKILKKK